MGRTFSKLKEEWRNFRQDSINFRQVSTCLEQEFQTKGVEDVRSFHIRQFLSMMDDKERKAILMLLNSHGYGTFIHPVHCRSALGSS